MLIHTPRFVLRDLAESDRAAFVAYQTDPRYCRLYDDSVAGEHKAQHLFDLFLAWQRESPRQNVQVGIFERDTGRLCGCAGLRMAGRDDGTAVFGIELNPDYWGRYRLAIEVASALIAYGFRDLELREIVGTTAGGNTRAEKLARWFGARLIARRDGPAWVAAPGWQAVDWALTREAWEKPPEGQT